MKKWIGIFGVFVLSCVLWGCGGVEPEQRTYPQAIAVDRMGEDYLVIFGLPDMQETTGQDKSGEESPRQNITVQGRDREEINRICSRTQEKYMDLGHVSVMILGDQLMRQGGWEELLSGIRRDPSMGEDIYLFTAEDVEKVMEYNGSETDALGDYLVGIYENRPGDRREEGVTLRQVYKTWYEKGIPGPLPRLAFGEDGRLEIEN